MNDQKKLESQIQALAETVDKIVAGLAETNSRLAETNSRLDETNSRLAETNSRLDETNSRLDETNSRLDETNSRLDARLAETNSRLDETNSRLDGRLDELTSIFIDYTRQQYANNEIVDDNFAKLNQKIDTLDDRVSKLHGDTNKNFKDVKLELVKLQKTTGYEELYQNLLKVNK